MECYKIDYNYNFGQDFINFAGYGFMSFAIWSIKLQFVIGN